MPQMEDFIEPSPTPTASSLQALQQQVGHLHSLLLAGLTALLLLGVVLTAFLWAQDYLVRKDLAAARKVVQDYETYRRPAINSFISVLQGYAQSHPDFNPILERYGIRPQAAPVAPPPGSTN